MGQSRRRNTCQYCSGQDHASSVCPWGVDIVQPIPALPRPTPEREEKPIRILWNTGACCFPSPCNFRHIYLSCTAPHRAWNCPQGPLRQCPQDRLHLRLTGLGVPASLTHHHHEVLSDYFGSLPLCLFCGFLVLWHGQLMLAILYSLFY